MLNSLLMVCAKMGVNMKVATPAGYQPPKDVLDEAVKIASEKKASIEISTDPYEAVKGSDIVYTDVWVSMGQEAEREKRLKDFAFFQVNEQLMSSAKKKALIMHCLPAHRGEEISGRIVETLKEIQSDLAGGSALDKQLKQELAPAFPDLEILSLHTETASLPDLELYELARQSYRELLETRDRSRDQAVARLAEEQVRAQNALDLELATLEALREYGKLLDEYPILLKAMYVQKLSGERLMSIPEFDLNSILE